MTSLVSARDSITELFRERPGATVPAAWAALVPGIELVWTEMANQVLGEDLRLVTGQQDRMARGGRVWAHPVAYDKLGLVYRRWRNFSVGDACPLPNETER